MSPGTEATFLGRDASNVHLAKRWNAELRIFEPGTPWVTYPIQLRLPGCRCRGPVDRGRGCARRARMGQLAAHRADRHHAQTAQAARTAAAGRRRLGRRGRRRPDGADLPECRRVRVRRAGRHPAVVFGAGPIGLITAQLVQPSRARPVIVQTALLGRLRSRKSSTWRRWRRHLRPTSPRLSSAASAPMASRSHGSVREFSGVARGDPQRGSTER